MAIQTKKPIEAQTTPSNVPETDAKYYYNRLYELAVTVNSASDPEDVIQSIVESLTKILHTKGCSLMLFNPNKQLLIHRAAYGLSDRYIKKGPVSVDQSISDALEGRPVAILDATTDKRMQYPEHAKGEGIKSVLSTPVMLKDEIKGVLRVYTSETHHFDDAEVFFVTACANLGAIALYNSERYNNLEEGYMEFRRSTF